jgi:hypothetical protein
MSITSIENLSNECLYEVFDYLDGYDIHKAFSNLNYRFAQLLKCSSLLFKIKVDSTSNKFYLNNCKQFILLNKHQIFSLHLSISSKKQRFFSLFPLNSSLDRLESLVLSKAEPKILFSLLSNLISLPRLFSLTINMWDRCDELDDIYKLIFVLPKLKYFKCLAEDSDLSISIPFALKNEFSRIEYLNIHHSFTLNELENILSYTPQLRRLNLSHLNNSNSIIEPISPIKLSNLIHIYFDTPYISFEELKMFITNLDCTLKVLRFVTRSSDVDYLDADRWEELIVKYLPQLEIFYFQYSEEIEHEYRCSTYLEDFNQFNSSFWIERKWEFETEIDSCEVMHSIRPSK